jgi:ABC-type dipeptide/oligopeptide/nickel transport system permease component
MTNYVLKRIGLMIVTTMIIIFMVFAFVRMMPDVRIEANPDLDPAILQMLLERDGLGKGPIIEQFFRWINNIFEYRSLGYSLREPREVTQMIGERLIVSIRINIIPYLISIPIGIGLGIWAALKKNRMTDHIISTGVMIFISVPSFIVGVLLQYYFAFRLNWVPWKVARGSDFTNDIWLGLASYILPILMLTIGGVAGLARLSRAELTEVLTSEFMLLCRTKGLNRRQATIRHGIRNALVPIAPGLIGGLVGILSGAIVTERIFSVFGIGTLYLEAFTATAGTRPDYPVIMALIMFYTLIGLSATLVIDLSYGVIDPRIRMGAGKR